MFIRKAEKQDVQGIERLLLQVLSVHHSGRPDIFKPNTTKYTAEELFYIISNPLTPVFVAVGDEGEILAHCFCKFIQYSNDNVLAPIKTLYIDDLCVDENCRGQHVGSAMYEYTKAFAKQEKCYNITLNVWACNGSAIEFYKAMGLATQKIGMEEIL